MMSGDAKRAARGACEGVFVRSTRPGANVLSADGKTAIPVSELTASAGGAALLLDDDHAWSFAGTVALIESAEAFWHHDLVLDVDLAIYTAGRMSSRRLLAWLASTNMEQCRYVHWGDYDPVGAAEYLRIAGNCPGRVTMHLPANLDSLIAQYGKRDLITGQVSMLHDVRKHTHDPTISHLIDCWDRHHRGLEQEILLRPCS